MTWKDELLNMVKNRTGAYSDLARRFGRTRQQVHYMLNHQDDISFAAYRECLDYCGKRILVDGTPLDPMEGGADLCRRMMKRGGLKQVDIAERAKVSPQAISKDLKKGSSFKASMVYGFAKMCGSTIKVVDK